MIKTSKRLISVLICLTLVLAMLPMAVFAADTTTLYCVAPEGWTACYIYWWGSDVDNPSWPGNAMSKGTDGIWYYEVPADADKVIFNNGSGTQSADLPMPTDDNVQFNYVAANWTTYGTVVDTPEIEYVDVYCETSWETTYAYWWGSSIENSASWPGNAMEKNADGLFIASVPADADGLIFNNNAGAQTGNLTVPTDDNVKFSIDGNAWGAMDAVVEIKYYVAGDEGLVGINWDPAGVQMEQNENGLYAASFENIADGDYKLKVTTGSWANSWGDPNNTEDSNNYVVTVAVAGSTVNVYFNAETEAVLVDVVAPVVEGETKELTLGDNVDLTMGQYTFTATQAGILGVNVTALAATDPVSGELSPMNPMMMGWHFTLEVNGVSNFMLNQEVTVAAGDVVSISLTSMNFADAIATINLSIREPGINDVKWQVSEDGTDLRLISYADSLDYSSITFNVTIGGITKNLECTAVYESINADGLVLTSAGEVFGNYSQYFVTWTLTDIPDALRGQEISVSVTWTPLEGEATTSETRVITVPAL